MTLNIRTALVYKNIPLEYGGTRSFVGSIKLACLCKNSLTIKKISFCLLHFLSKINRGKRACKMPELGHAYPGERGDVL